MAEDKHLPSRHPIEKFGNGGFRFGGMSHQGSLLILPSGMRALDALLIGDVTPAQLSGLVHEKQAIDFVIVGTGAEMLRMPPALSEFLKGEGLHIDAMSTSSAVSVYNVLLAEDRRVAAILIAVGAAHG